jgi:exosortase A
MHAAVLGRTGVERGSLVLLAVVGIAVLAVAIFHATFAGMLSIWELSNYRHCLLVFPVALYILWDRRAMLAAAPIAPSWAGLGWAVAVALLWRLGRATGVQLVEHAAAIAAIPALVLAVLGTRCFRAAAFPVLFLFAAVPFGDELIPLLMDVTADISVWLLQASGMPANRAGVFVSVPAGEFEIADVCAGLNYLLAGVTVALLLSYWLFRTARARAVFVALAAVGFVVGNGVRAFIVMTVASATQMRYFTGKDHVIFGVIFFMALFGLMIWLGSKYAHAPADPVLTAPPPFDSAARTRSIVAGVLAAAILASAPVSYAIQSDAAPLEAGALVLPSIAGCAGPDSWSADWSPRLHAPDAEVRGTYRCNGVTLHLFAAEYAGHVQGREIASSDNVLVPTRWWWSGARSDREVRMSHDKRLRINEVQMTETSGSLLAWYWYSVNGTSARSSFDVKVQELLATLALKPTVSRAYVVAASGPTEQSERLRARVLESASAMLRQEAQ